MKRILSILIGIIAFTGCEMAEVDPNANDSLIINAEMVNYQVGMDLGDDTKTYVKLEDEKYKIFWSKGDVMNIFAGINNDNADELVLVKGEGTKNGSFSGPYFASTELNENLLHQTVLVYPFDESNTCVANDDKTEYTIGMTIPSVQQYTAGTFANGAYPMVGVTQTPKEIVVNTKNVNAAIVIPLKGDVTISKIVLSAVNPLAGRATVKAAYGSAPVATINQDGASYKVELVCKDGVELKTNEATDFHISFAPCGDCPVDATIYATDGTYMVLEGAKPNNDGKFDSNDYVVMPVVEYVKTGDQKEDLKKAFKNGGIFTLQSDLTIPYHVEINSGKSLTVDLNGYTLTCTAELTGTAACFKSNNADLRFMNGTIKRSKGNYIFTMSSYATSYLALTDVNIVKTNSDGGVLYYSNGINAEFNNVNVDAKCNIFCTSSGKLGNIKINGGKYKTTKNCFYNVPGTMSVTFEGEPKFSDKSYAAVKWEETGDTECPYTPGGVIGATVDGVGYVNLQDAVNAAISSENNEIQLAANVQLEEALVIGGTAPVQTKSGNGNVNVEINLNGKTITSDGDVFDVRSGATLTLNGKGTVKAGSNDLWVAVWANGGNVIINGGNYSVGPDANGETNDCIYAKKGGQITINGGTFSNVGTYVASNGGVVINANNGDENAADAGKIIINGGTFNPAEGCVPYEQKDVEANRVVVNTVASEAELKVAVAAGKPVKLGADIMLTSALTIDKAVQIDLNGYTIENRSAANTTMLGNVADECIVFYVSGANADLTLNATNGGKVVATGNGSTSFFNVAVWVANGAKATLNGGEYSNTADPDGDGCDLIYARDGGKIYVTGGAYKAGAIRSNLGGGIYSVLNCRDNSGAVITVSGGKFYEFGAVEASKVGKGEIVISNPNLYWSGKDNDGYYTITDQIVTEEALKAAVAAGINNITLGADITLSDCVEIRDKVITINLNGKKIVHPSTSSATYKDVFEIFGSGELIIDGEGSCIAEDGYAIYAAGDSKVTLKNGYYFSPVSAVDARKNAVVTINGGEFKVDGTNNPDGDFGQKYTLNLRDKTGNNTGDKSAIIVKGGKFYKFNPADNAAEGEGTNFVAPGYSSVANDDWYEVKVGIYNELALKAALNKNFKSISLNSDIIISSPILVTNTLEFNLGNYNITAPSTDAFEVLGELTINGNGKVSAGTKQNETGSVCAVWAHNGGKVIINGGHYTVGPDKNNKRNDCIYAGSNASVTDGTITINGGKFEFVAPDDYSGENGDKFLINGADKTNSKITIAGGEFKNYVPGKEIVAPAGKEEIVLLDNNKKAYNNDTEVTSAHSGEEDKWYIVR